MKEADVHVKSILCRSSQPLLTVRQRRCVEDEQYLGSLLSGSAEDWIRQETDSPDASAMQGGVVVDARTKLNAQASRQRGGGYEPEAHYSRLKLYFTGIERLETIKATYSNLCELLRQSDAPSGPAVGLRAAYLSHLHAILRVAVSTTKFLCQQENKVLIHCEDGLDMTSILVSLTKCMHDPYYRTAEGFLDLIQEDWVEFGFPFFERANTSAPASITTTDTCGELLKGCFPTFAIFLDGVRHLMMQHADQFSFNEEALLWLLRQQFRFAHGTCSVYSPTKFSTERPCRCAREQVGISQRFCPT